MKPLHTHWAPQTILGFASIHVFLLTVSGCASKLHARTEIMVYVPAFFISDISSVSLASLRITSDFWNNVVIDQQNLFAAVQESSAVLMIIWLDFPWRNTSILIVPPIPLMGSLPWWATLQCQSMPIDQQIETGGGNKLKDEARPELCCTSITPKNNFCQRYMFPHFFDDETYTHQHCYPGGEQTESWLFKISTLNIILLFVFIWLAISTWRIVSPSFILVLHELYVANYVCFLLMCSLSSITICY